METFLEVLDAAASYQASKVDLEYYIAVASMWDSARVAVLPAPANIYCYSIFNGKY